MPSDLEALGWKKSEKDEVASEAAPYLDATPQERWAAFISIQRMVGAAWAGLNEAEMRARLRIGEMLEPRPDPWWKNIRLEALR
jgi:hypothetical protein